MKQTVLLPVHETLGARLVPFGGYRMPVQYSGILEEARAVRGQAGVFDLCHMGRVFVTGRDAEPFLQRLQTNDAAKIAPGRIRYAMILDENGYVLDDILVYREPAGEGFMLVVNASNTARDLEIMRQTADAFGDVRIDDRTEQIAMIALQGPAAATIVQQITDIDLGGLRYYAWARGAICDSDAALSRTGYTGEDGFELYVRAPAAIAVWNRVLEVGEREGLTACGLGARDILRLEAGMPLYGHEIDETRTPLDAGLDFAVKFTHDFIGREALERAGPERGDRPRLVGLTTDSRRVPRQGYAVIADGSPIGEVCSGGSSPTLQKNIATAYVEPRFAEPGTPVEFAIRDKREPAVVVELPFYKRER